MIRTTAAESIVRLSCTLFNLGSCGPLHRLRRPDPDRPGRLDAVPVDLDVAALDGLLRHAAGLEEPRVPQPLVNAQFPAVALSGLVPVIVAFPGHAGIIGPL